jgi:PIN domain nuclease of toxin-antitoxin system
VGVRHLIDTHALLWLLTAVERVPEAVRAVPADRSNTLEVSAVSALEITTKIKVGKLDAPAPTFTLPRRIHELGTTPLPISADHALLAGSLAREHRDPFDRILLAQATLEDALW